MRKESKDGVPVISASRKRLSVHAVAWIVCVILYCLSGRASSAAWVSLGPDGADFRGTVVNPANPAQVTAITVNPNAVYRSSNGGGSWSKIGLISSSSFAEDMSAFSFLRLYVLAGGKCYRSADGGATWTSAAFPANYETPQAVCAHPTNSAIVYAAGHSYNSTYGTQFAFFKSTNGGQTWSGLRAFSFTELMIHDMAVAKTNPNVIYVCGYKAAAGHSQGALFKSSNGGSTWSDISNSVDVAPYQTFYTVAIDPTNANRVYVGGAYVYRSATGGASWVRISGISSVSAFAVDPTNPSRVHAASDGIVYVSTNWGQTWTKNSNTVCEGVPSQIEVAPSLSSNVYLSTYLGLFKSSNWGSTWVEAEHGIVHTDIVAIAVAPSLPSTVFVERNYRGVYASGNSGSNWQRKPRFMGTGNVSDLLVHPTRPNVVLAGSVEYRTGATTIYRSSDGGNIWPSVDTYLDQAYCLAQDPSRPDVSYVGGSHGGKMSVCKSQDTGITWGCRREPTPDYGSCYGIAVAKSNFQYVYAVGISGGSGKVFRSGNAGDSWQNFTNNLSSLHLTSWHVNAVAVHPSSQFKVFVGTTNGVFASNSGGLTWGLAFTLPANALAYDSAHGTLYAATESNGLFYTKNEGMTWQALNAGLGSLNGQSLGINAVNHYLFLGTNGNGVWRTSLVP